MDLILSVYITWPGVRAPVHRRVQQIEGLLRLGHEVLEGSHSHALYHHYRHAAVLPGALFVEALTQCSGSGRQ